MKIINPKSTAFLRNLEKAFYKDNYQNRKLGRVGRPYEHKEASEEKSWDKIEDFYKKGSDENKLWQCWYKLQKTGDHSWMGVFRDILAQKFPKINSWSQTAPNTGKKIITAKNKSGDIIAAIDLSGDKVDLTALQTFMDKCHEGKSETEKLIDKTETLKNAEGKRLDAIIKYSNSAEEEGVEGIKVAKDATDDEKKIAIAKFYKEAAEGDAENLDEIVEEALADYVPEKIESIKDLPWKEDKTIVLSESEVPDKKIKKDNIIIGSHTSQGKTKYYIKDNSINKNKEVSEQEVLDIYNGVKTSKDIFQ